MWRFLQRLRRREHDALPSNRGVRDADEIRDLFAPLRQIQPDAAARSEGRAKLQAAVVAARAERRRPRLAGVRAFSIVAAGIAGSSVLVASAATGTDPVSLVVNVADWSVPAWDGSPELLRESVTVESYDPGTGIVEGITVDGVPLTLLLPSPGRETAAAAEALERGTKIEVTLEAADDRSEPSVVSDVVVVSTPPPDLAREPAPEQDAQATRAPEPTIAPRETELADPRETPKADDRDEPVIATVEPTATEPKPGNDVNTDPNAGALDPHPTRTPTPTAEPTPKLTEPVEPTPTPGSTSADVGDSTASNLEATDDTGEANLDDGETPAR